MKKLLIFCCLICNIYAISADRVRMAILDINAGVGVEQSTVDGLADMLSVELYNSRYFTIVERLQVDKILQVNNIMDTQTLTPAQRKAIGNALAVEAICIGTINYIIRDVKIASDGTSKINVGEYNVDIRLVSVSTGEMLSSAGGVAMTGETERALMKRVAQELAMNLDKAILSEREPFLLLNYLYVYPEDLGTFTAPPYHVIDILNRNNTYGFNDWRIPTQEEMDLLRANARAINLIGDVNYAYNNYWTHHSGSCNIRLVRTKVVTRQQTQQVSVPYFENTVHDYGKIPMLNGKVRAVFRLQNPSPNAVTIQNVSKTNSNLQTSWDRTLIPPGETGCVYVIYDPNGRQGSRLNSTIIVTLSNGQTFNLRVLGIVE